MTNNHLRQGILHATLITPDLHATCAAYAEQLGLAVGKRDTLDAATADVLGLPGLRDQPLIWLANDAGEAILRVIEDPTSIVGEPMFRHGWLSLEVLVGDIDALAGGLRAPFRVLGAPADLELSPAIRASQVIGPCGEMLYLTQIKAPVPPFDLPMTDDRIARPFIGVMSTPDRTASQAAWAALAGANGWAFDTRITVLNRAFGRELEGRYPVAVVPLTGQCLVEIDQVDLPQAPTRSTNERSAGLHSVALRLPGLGGDNVPAGWELVGEIQNSTGNRHLGLRGPAGEHIELTEFSGS
ncbi:VOC family protein [Lysobacter sp. A378]